jgi:tRNA(Arg) A34 adenosine deaminase TadA
MTHIEEYMEKAIQFAHAKNRIWPFSALIMDESGDILCQATDCAHISPLFHAESLAIHAMIKNRDKFSDQLNNLSLVTTAEPDPLSQSAIHWASIVQEIKINTVYYGSSLGTIEKLWPFGINIPAQEIIDRSATRHIKLEKNVLEQECNKLFLNAKKEQEIINSTHPAKGQLSTNIEDFYCIRN